MPTDAEITRLIELVQGFAGKRALVVGDLYLDRTIRGDADQLSPEAPVPVLRVVSKEHHAGGIGSVAGHLSALGIGAICCGVIGRDGAGDRLLDWFAECGCDFGGVIRAADRTTARRTRMVGLAQHRHPQQLMRVDEQDAKPLPEELADELCHEAEARLPEADVLCVEDSNDGLISERVAQYLIQAGRRQKIPVLVDPAAGKDFRWYRGATLITPNRNEFRLITGHSSDQVASYGESAAALRDRLKLDALVVTLDRDGALLVDQDGEAHHIPTRRRRVYDITGAGDAIFAMLAAAVSAGAPLAEAVQLANITGGLEVEKYGNVPIAQGEVLADLRQQREKDAKVRTEAELLQEVALRRGRGESIVFTNGCFDLLHPGHQQLLARCKALGDVLIVAVNSDASVQMNKGPNRPIQKEHERAGMLAALECVDYVMIFGAETPLELIKKIRPDVLAKGGDYKGGWVCGREFVESYGGQVEVLPLFEGYSTTSVLDRIRNGGAE